MPKAKYKRDQVIQELQTSPRPHKVNRTSENESSISPIPSTPLHVPIPTEATSVSSSQYATKGGI